MLTNDSYRTGTADTPICDCGHALETTEHFLLHCNRYEKERKDMFDFIYHSGITTKQNKSSIITAALLLSPLCDKSKLGTPNRDTIKKIQIAFITLRFQACRKRQLKLASVLLYSLLCCSI